jgi:integrase
VTKGKIRSAKTREKWESVLRLHLLPAFGDFFLDGIRRADIEAWLERMGKVFLAGIRRLFPQHFGIVALGFATGLRPSSLRPLRRQGPRSDVRWDQGVVLVRRSHTRRDEVMEATKQKTRYRITLPDDLTAVLRWHLDRLPPGPMRDSDLLFPSETGGFRAAPALDKPFRQVGKAIGLRKRITPRAMRRTFQDLARNADIETIARRRSAVTPRRRCPTSTARSPPKEFQAAVGAVISLAKYRELLRDGASWWEGRRN